MKFYRRYILEAEAYLHDDTTLKPPDSDHPLRVQADVAGVGREWLWVGTEVEAKAWIEARATRPNYIEDPKSPLRVDHLTDERLSELVLAVTDEFWRRVKKKTA